MIKARAWPVRAMYMLIAAALVISLIIVAAPTQKVAADTVTSEWSRVSTPSVEDGVLAPGSVIAGFAPAVGEVIYAIVVADVWEGELLPYYLLKSTDGAATWKEISKGVKAEIDKKDLGDLDSLVSVACDFADPSFVAVALDTTGASDPTKDGLHVFISDDGGTTFRDTGVVNIPADGVFKFVVSGELAGVRNIVIGGTDSPTTPTDALLFRCLAIGDVGTGWMDATGYAGWDNKYPGDPDSSDDITSIAVVDIKFAPSWATDKTILVLTVPNTLGNVYLQSGSWGTVEAWNNKAGFEKAVPILTGTGKFIPLTDLGTLVAGINTPLDYSGQDAAKRYVWVNVNYVDISDLDNPLPVGKIFLVIDGEAELVGPKGQIKDGKVWLTNVSYLGYISAGRAIASLLGDGTADLTECCKGVDIYRNDTITNMDICCISWKPACKPPTGRLAMAAFYISADKAYAVALGPQDESAWSVSFDDGDTWNQLSLVNTQIDYLSDVAVSPDCNKTMLVSVNLDSGCECDSVWLHADNLPEAPEYSGKWLRTWCGQLGDEQYGLLRLAPEETTGDTVYLVDRGTSTIYWNELETLACWKERGATSIVDNIVDLAVKDESTIYALDVSGAVAMSDDHGAAPSWEKAVDSTVTNGWTIAVLGEDILVGGRDGDVSYSADGGETFTELKDVATAGFVTVAFDSYFDTNDTIYAALAQTDGYLTGGIFRLVLDPSEDFEVLPWEDLKADKSAAYTGLVLDRPAPGNPMTSADTGGVLYASYITDVEGQILTGVARCLTPAEDACCEELVWDYLVETEDNRILNAEAFYMMPKALKICGCLTADSNSKLFAIDGIYAGDGPGYDMAKGRDGTVWSFEDCYAKETVALSNPADGKALPSDPCPEVCQNLEFALKWDRPCDACAYDIQIATDKDFTEIVRNIQAWRPPEGAGMTPTYLVLRGALWCDGTFYWRVRAVEAETYQMIRSWWSEERSFTMGPAPGTGISLTAPEAGAINVAITDVSFTWEMTASSDTYDWVLSANADLSSPVESKTGLTTTAYTCTMTLDYDTTSYWQVTAYKDGAEVSTSTIGTFRTMVEPTGPVDPVVPTTPIWVWVVIAIGAVLVIVVIVLIFRTRRV